MISINLSLKPTTTPPLTPKHKTKINKKTPNKKTPPNKPKQQPPKPNSLKMIYLKNYFRSFTWSQYPFPKKSLLAWTLPELCWCYLDPLWQSALWPVPISCVCSAASFPLLSTHPRLLCSVFYVQDGHQDISNLLNGPFCLVHWTSKQLNFPHHQLLEHPV